MGLLYGLSISLSSRRLISTFVMRFIQAIWSVRYPSPVLALPSKYEYDSMDLMDTAGE